PSNRSPRESAAPALDPAEFRRLGHRAVDLVADYLEGIRHRPVFRPMTPDERAELLSLPLPAHGRPGAALLDDAERLVLPHPMGNGHPRFFGWVNSPPAPMGVLAELIAAAVDPSCAGCGHPAIYPQRAGGTVAAGMVGLP